MTEKHEVLNYLQYSFILLLQPYIQADPCFIDLSNIRRIGHVCGWPGLLILRVGVTYQHANFAYKQSSELFGLLTHCQTQELLLGGQFCL